MTSELLTSVATEVGRDADRLDLVVHRGSRGDRGCTLVFVYERGRPLAVAKFGRTDDVAIEREIDALRAVGELVAGSRLALTTERLMTSFRLANGRLVALKELGSGTPALRYIGANKRRAVSVVHDAVSWLIELHVVADQAAVVEPAAKMRIASNLNADAPATAWWRTFADHPGFVGGPAHGDFLLTNLLVERARLSAVIDFENYRADGLPFADLVGLLVATGTTFLGHTHRAIDSMFVTDSWISRRIRQELRRYGDARGISVDELVIALPVYSDRSIDIARRWGLTTQANFHRELRDLLISQADRIRSAWR